MSQSLVLKRLPVVLGDIIALQISLVVMLWLRYGTLNQNLWHQHLPAFAWVTGFWVIGLFVTGLYDPTKSRNGLAFFRLFLEGMIANLLVAFAFFYLLPVFGIAPRTTLLLFFAVSCAILYVWRLGWNRLSFQDSLKNRLLVIGAREDILSLYRLLADGTLGMNLVAAIQTDTATSDLSEEMLPTEVRWETDIAALDRLIAEARVTAIVPGHGVNDIPAVRDALYRLLFSPIALLDRRELEESLTGRIPLAHVDKAWFIEHLREPEKAWYDAAKRAGDVVLSVPFGIITLVLMPVVALLIKASAPGPVFIHQTREGRHGKPFTLLKFRTMIANAPDGSAEGTTGPQFTASAKADPRLFPIGRFLRQLRIDELPQIWNVLRGDMSFVGPRPERPAFVKPLVEQMPYYALRHLARPGLTGWAQVQFTEPTASLKDNLKKLQYDLYYIQHRSLVLDAAILLKTIGIVLRRQGT
ncbi:MAG: hypothetical protein RL141_930 [Candidatus Parcubacteria bacterium]|jgi:exopolysaccharide biosynthesis polyprenyl glycosylphosphotransferase